VALTFQLSRRLEQFKNKFKTCEAPLTDCSLEVTGHVTGFQLWCGLGGQSCWRVVREWREQEFSNLHLA
jgi:hypothetical protein